MPDFELSLICFEALSNRPPGCGNRCCPTGSEWRKVIQKTDRTLVTDCTQKQNWNCSFYLITSQLDQCSRKGTNLVSRSRRDLYFGLETKDQVQTAGDLTRKAWITVGCRDLRREKVHQTINGFGRMKLFE